MGEKCHGANFLKIQHEKNDVLQYYVTCCFVVHKKRLPGFQTVVVSMSNLLTKILLCAARACHFCYYISIYVQQSSLHTSRIPSLSRANALVRGTPTPGATAVRDQISMRH